MERDPAAWRRLSETVRAHRTRKNWSQQELARRAGVSTKSVVTIESGKAPTRMPPTLPRIAETLGWADGSIEAVLDGGDPFTGETGPPAGPVSGGASGRAVAALRQAMEFSRICAELGADPNLLARFDAAAEELLTSALTAAGPPEPSRQERYGLVAHTPGGHDISESDRALIEAVVQQLRAEQRERREG
ncbi:helix-turn-helix transcriptional regulator [Streptomyces sp. B8F3]|uniref:helix-turn-helix transcriptional regulator n=1 Tax=Streptomyces sp. B8F3 TaxID=3153573 RepID=UPI00325C3903